MKVTGIPNGIKRESEAATFVTIPDMALGQHTGISFVNQFRSSLLASPALQHFAAEASSANVQPESFASRLTDAKLNRDVGWGGFHI